MNDLRKYINLVENTLIPMPNALKVDVTLYEFQTLMKEFRGQEDTESRGDSGLVMFYSEEEKKQFEDFLKKRGVSYKDIGHQ